ncbi:DUF2789 domain-containing protein [Shewanella sp. GXUN23E]|uniref:DUF2789 domain-containing protein n=1 Tax=Shewanella sp. GXUN23E TaxID=3422498 RepID=UPI003D7E9DC5
MDTTPTDLSHLFAQLGLAADEPSIETFIAGTRLPADVCLSDAPFWNSAQREFIKEAMMQDSNWSELLDQLDARVRQTGP